MSGDPVANAIPDPGTQAYLDAVDRKVDRTVNIVSGVLGVGGAALRGASAAGRLLAETSEAVRVAEGVPTAKGAANIAADEIRFSQNSVSYNKVDRATGQSFTYDELVTSMRTNGWKGDPVDVIKMPDGRLTSMDNTRINAAREAGIDVKANVHSFDELLPVDMVDQRRFGNAQTWGEAITGRINKQTGGFGENNPNGSSALPRLTRKPGSK